MSLPAGTRIGSFEIVESIGAGGMGEVFRARDETLRRDVAIKILPAEFAHDPDRRERFAREARLLASLNHPHIAQVYAVEQFAPGAAIVMELVPGRTLREVLRGGDVSTRDALAYAREIALALDAAHEKGIIHRDLKPANIAITPDGAVKVLDFGLAKSWTTDAAAPAHQTTIAVPSREGEVVGTVGYMSPEQARGLPVDRRTDIWAFGCVLFELFSGRAPFDAPTTSDTIAAVLERDPDWEALRRSAPPRVRDLIRRCLQKDRRERLRDIGDALHELGDGSTSGANVAPAPFGVTGAGQTTPFTRTVMIALAALAITTTATTIWLWVRGSAPVPSAPLERPVRFPLPPPAATRFESPVPNVEATTVAFSPDGGRLAFIATPSGKPPQVWVRPVEAEEARAVPGTEGAISVFWSPDSRSLGFFAAGKLKRIEHTGGASVSICDVPLGVGVAGTWGETGEILYATVQGDAIFRVLATPGAKPSIAIPGGPGRRVMWPRFLPGGRRFLYSRLGATMDGEIVLVDADGREHSLVPALSLAQFVEPDVLLYVRDAALVAQRFDLATTRLVGEPVAVVGPIAYSASTGWANVTASPNGMLALQTHLDVSQMVIVSRSGVVEGVIGRPAGYLSVRISPDGSTLLYSRLRPELGTYDIWSTPLARHSETPVTSAPGTEIAGVWASGLRMIIMAAGQGGAPNLYLHDSVSGKATQLARHPRFQIPADVSPDGKTLVYAQRTELGNWDLMQMPIDDPGAAAPLRPTPFSETNLRFSPAGGQVAFVSDESGHPEVYVAPYPEAGNKRIVSTGGGVGPRWRRDGRELYFRSRSGDLMSVPIDRAGEPGTPVRLFNTGRWVDFDVMPDGSRFIAIALDSAAAEQPLTVLLNWQRVIGPR